MNRLFIIGNGFDLAHGLPTRYSDFILDYFNNSFKKCYSKKNGRYYQFDGPLFKLETTYSGLEEHTFQTIKEGLDFIKKNNPHITIDFSVNSFFEKVIKNYEVNDWVELENLYYFELNSLLSQYRTSDISIKAKELNFQFDQIKKELIKYLETSIIGRYYAIRTPEFSEIFSREIKESKDLKKAGQTLRQFPKRTCFLNFNYTNTLDIYTKKLEASYFTINIHGKIGDLSNEIVFGYGDELDQKYKEIENYNDNTLLEHFKSFWYHRTNNYSNLMNFLDDNYFQVYVIGHSCGLSDRTLLNNIFENKKCTSVTLFHYGGLSGFTQKIMNASRHFENKNLQRDRIVSFKESNECPKVQWKPIIDG